MKNDMLIIGTRLPPVAAVLQFGDAKKGGKDDARLARRFFLAAAHSFLYAAHKLRCWVVCAAPPDGALCACFTLFFRSHV